jgi:hypothetical protein
LAEPIVFITTMAIHEGKLEEFKEATAKSIKFLEENGPQMMASVHIDEDQMIANGLQVHRNSDSILQHWQLADPYMRDVMQYTTTESVAIYGQPNDAVIAGMQRLASVGATVVVRPRLAGFSRFPETA